jgi:hypothetical protein
MKTKADIKESEKNTAQYDEWNDYSSDPDYEPTAPTEIKEKEYSNKQDPKKLGDILKDKQPIVQKKREHGDRKPYKERGEGGPGVKKFYNNNKNYENKGGNYENKGGNYENKGGNYENKGGNYENKFFEKKTYENKGYENKNYENKNYENKSYENKTYENKNYENKNYENKGGGFENRGNYENKPNSERGGNYENKGRGNYENKFTEKRQYENKNYNHEDKQQQQPYENKNNNYNRRDKEGDKQDLEKKIGNFANVLMDNEKANQNFKYSTKSYDTTPVQRNRDEDGMSMPSFVNPKKGEGNFRDLNQDQDLYLKNLRNKGLDKEEEREHENEKGEEGDNEDTEHPTPKRAHTQKNYNQSHYKPRKQYHENNYEQHTNGRDQHEEHVNDDNWVKPQQKTSYRGNTENDIWNSVLGKEEEVPVMERKKTHDKRKYEKKWEAEEEYVEKPVEIVKEKPVTKIEFKMKVSATGKLDDLFKKKEKK